MEQVVFSTIFALAVVAILLYVRAKRKKRWDLFLKNRSVSSIITNIGAYDFEVWVEMLFLSIGAKARVTPEQGDHGIDVVAEYQGRKIGVQCKKYYGNKLVGEPVLRDLYGVKHAEGYDQVALITTGNFSYEALTWQKTKAPDMILINAQLLDQIIKDKNILAEFLK